MPTHADDLDNCLQGKDAYEDNIDDVQCFGVDFCLSIMFHRHRDHVADDEQDDCQLKLGVDRHIKEECLKLVLQKRKVKSVHMLDSVQPTIRLIVFYGTQVDVFIKRQLGFAGKPLGVLQ